MYLYIYKCIYVFYVYMYLCIYVCIYIYIYVYMYIYVNMYLCVHVCIYIYMYVYMSMWIYEDMKVWMYVYIDISISMPSACGVTCTFYLFFVGRNTRVCVAVDPQVCVFWAFCFLNWVGFFLLVFALWWRYVTDSNNVHVYLHTDRMLRYDIFYWTFLHAWCYVMISSLEHFWNF